MTTLPEDKPQHDSAPNANTVQSVSETETMVQSALPVSPAPGPSAGAPTQAQAQTIRESSQDSETTPGEAPVDSELASDSVPSSPTETPPEVDGKQAFKPEGIARAREVLIEIVRTTIQVAVLFVIISTLMGRYEIHQISMEPNFHEGERVIVSRLDWLWDTVLVRFAKITDASSSPFQPNVGDVVVFKSPSGFGDALIKRVVGVPGDTIEIRDNQIWRNGEPLDEPYINGLPTSCNTVCKPITLEPDTFFMAGDNRPSSLDSRSFGPVPGDNLIGRVVARYWPLNRLGIFF